MPNTRTAVPRTWAGVELPRMLVGQPMSETPWRTVRNAKTEEESLELLLYDFIGLNFFGEGIDPTTLVKEIRNSEAKTIDVRINSPGGLVFDAVAIHNALREHPARVVTHVDALAASAASFVAMAGDEIRMADNAFIMIHKAHGLTVGNEDDHRETAALLAQMDKMIGNIYAKRTGNSRKTVLDMMAAETWMDAEQATEAGFADTVVDGSEDGASSGSENRFDLSVFMDPPAPLRDAVAAAVAEAEGQAAEPNVRDLERALRDAGMSRSQAKASVAGMKEAGLLRDAADDQKPGLPNRNNDRDLAGAAASAERLLQLIG